MTLMRQDLDAAECNNPQCKADHPLVLYAKCHPEGKFVVSYDRGRGVMILLCDECSATVMEVEVASAPIQ